MKRTSRFALLGGLFLSVACQDSIAPYATSSVPNSTIGLASHATQVAGVYVADFVATAATGISMNDAGDIIGTSYKDIGCGPFCLPPLETVVWRGGSRTVLPSLPGFAWPGIFPQVINSQGWIAGVVGSPYVNTRAVVWRPNGSSYEITDRGILPRTKVTQVGGMANFRRIVRRALDARPRSRIHYSI